MHKTVFLINNEIQEQGHVKTGLRGFQPSPTQTELYSHRRWLEAWNVRFKKERDCTTGIYVAKTKALISFAVTAKLICVFIFTYAKSRFSHDAAELQEQRHVKKCLRGFRPSPTQTELYSHRRWLEAWNFRFKK